jgi:hypothetical protein
MHTQKIEIATEATTFTNPLFRTVTAHPTSTMSAAEALFASLTSWLQNECCSVEACREIAATWRPGRILPPTDTTSNSKVHTLDIPSLAECVVVQIQWEIAQKLESMALILPVYFSILPDGTDDANIQATAYIV